jgi:hypothetical protein
LSESLSMPPPDRRARIMDLLFISVSSTTVGALWIEILSGQLHTAL